MQDIRGLLEIEIEQSKKFLKKINGCLNTKYKGTMVCQYRNGSFKYYVQVYNKKTCKTRQKYIGNENTPEVIERKKQKYYQVMKARLETNLKSLEKIVLKINNYMPSDIYEKLPFSYRDAEFVAEVDEVVHNEMKYSFIKNENMFKFEDNPNITIDGTEVRSKGEVIIYNMLWSYGVDFKYEAALEIVEGSGFKGKVVPDFVIALMDTTDFFWEHLGKLDDVNYVNRFAKKMYNYHANGIVVGENLILTADRKGGTINSKSVNDIIVKFILPRCKFKKI